MLCMSRAVFTHVLDRPRISNVRYAVVGTGKKAHGVEHHGELQWTNVTVFTFVQAG